MKKPLIIAAVLAAVFVGAYFVLKVALENPGLDDSAIIPVIRDHDSSPSAASEISGTFEDSPELPTPAASSSPAADADTQLPPKAVMYKNRVFALTPGTNPDISPLLNNSSIDGVALQLGWSQFETKDNIYTWTFIDNNIEAAKAKGKKVTLHIFSSFNPPNWLASTGAKYYTYTDFQGRSRTEPIPWDSVFLAKYTEFLDALAGHLKAKNYTDSVDVISVATPVGEMTLISCMNGVLASGVSYNRVAYLSAWKQMVDAYAKYFPNTDKVISAPVNVICMPDKDTSFYREVMDYALSAYGNSFGVFAADLTALGSDRTKPYLDYASKTSFNYQTIWSATNDTNKRMKGAYPTNLKDAVCAGLSHGATYFEIYGADVLNSDPAIQGALSAAHTPSLCN